MNAYVASPRERRTKARIGQLRLQMYEVLAHDHPQSVRHVFYRMTDPRLPEPVEKSERGYVTVQRQLVAMRLSGAVPFGWMGRLVRTGENLRSHDRHPERGQSNTEAGPYPAQVLGPAGVPRAPDRTTIDHALIRGLVTARPVVRQGPSSL